jgi:hypothetical protein
MEIKDEEKVKHSKEARRGCVERVIEREQSARVKQKQKKKHNLH